MTSVQEILERARDSPNWAVIFYVVDDVRFDVTRVERAGPLAKFGTREHGIPAENRLQSISVVLDVGLKKQVRPFALAQQGVSARRLKALVTYLNRQMQDNARYPVFVRCYPSLVEKEVAYTRTTSRGTTLATCDAPDYRFADYDLVGPWISTSAQIRYPVVRLEETPILGAGRGRGRQRSSAPAQSQREREEEEATDMEAAWAAARAAQAYSEVEALSDDEEAEQCASEVAQLGREGQRALARRIKVLEDQGKALSELIQKMTDHLLNDEVEEDEKFEDILPFMTEQACIDYLTDEDNGNKLMLFLVRVCPTATFVRSMLRRLLGEQLIATYYYTSMSDPKPDAQYTYLPDLMRVFINQCTRLKFPQTPPSELGRKLRTGINSARQNMWAKMGLTFNEAGGRPGPAE